MNEGLNKLQARRDNGTSRSLPKFAQRWAVTIPSTWTLLKRRKPPSPLTALAWKLKRLAELTCPALPLQTVSYQPQQGAT